MFTAPRRGSQGCALVPIGFLLTLASILFIAWSVAAAMDMLIGLFLVTGTVGAILGFFATVTWKEIFNDNKFVVIEPRDAVEAQKPGVFTRIELKSLDEVKESIDNAPSHEEVIGILSGQGGEGEVVPANPRLRPIAFTLRPVNRWRYAAGVMLEVATWAGVVVSAPVLLLLAVLTDVTALWDGGKTVLYRAIRLSRRARRYRIRPHSVLQHDDRDPILYLRAFSEDYGERLEGFFPATPEEDMAAYYNRRHGPMLAVGEPREDIPLLGATRIYFDNSVWKAGVLYLMSISQLVIIQAGFAPGLWWEIGVARQRLPPQKLIISFAAWDTLEEEKRRLSYLRFRKYAEELLRCELPPDIGGKKYLSFKSDWSAT